MFNSIKNLGLLFLQAHVAIYMCLVIGLPFAHMSVDLYFWCCRDFSILLGPASWVLCPHLAFFDDYGRKEIGLFLDWSYVTWFEFLDLPLGAMQYVVPMIHNTLVSVFGGGFYYFLALSTLLWGFMHMCVLFAKMKKPNLFE